MSKIIITTIAAIIAILVLLSLPSLSTTKHEMQKGSKIITEKKQEIKMIEQERNMLEQERRMIEQERRKIEQERNMLEPGKDELKKFAKKIVYSPYIVEIVNSLPFNPKQKDIIRKYYPDGKIEIVLTRTDAGYGIVVQTTGRNLRETKAISNIIKKKLGRTA